MKSDLLFVTHPYSDNFNHKWDEWKQYLKEEKRKRFKLKKTEQRMLNKFIGFTEEEAISAIDNAMCSLWSSVFPKKISNGNTKTESGGNDRIKAISNW
jgi:hypothetical protein